MKEIEKAKQWYISEDIECHINDGSLYINVKGFEIEVHSNEISYRAELWGDSSETTSF
jgi:hypothetical protein